MKSRRPVTYLLYTVAVGLCALAAAALPHFRPRPPLPVLSPPTPPVPVAPTHVDPPPPPPPQAKQEPPEVDVVFALDTTSSMTGLIDGAKRKIWSMVNFISSAQPQPKVRIGLVAYRDLGDSYVTRFYDLSDDFDKVFDHLRGFRAEGGGDTPEHVAKALSDAVTRPSWTVEREGGPKVARLIYVVGDAPGHTDYQDGYDYRALAKKAAAQGIHVNTIRCGDDPDAEHYFREIAKLGKGQYSSVDESGGVADERTPFDDKLALLNKRLLGTAIGYGRGAGAMEAKAAAAAAAPAAVAADRAAFAARNHLAVTGDGDLLGALGTIGKGAGYVNSLPASDLPSSLAAMSPKDREDFVAKKKAERDDVTAEIDRVAKERESYLRRSRPAKASGFDDRVRSSLKDETAGVLAF